MSHTTAAIESARAAHQEAVTKYEAELARVTETTGALNGLTEQVSKANPDDDEALGELVRQQVIARARIEALQHRARIAKSAVDAADEQVQRAQHADFAARFADVKQQVAQLDEELFQRCEALRAEASTLLEQLQQRMREGSQLANFLGARSFETEASEKVFIPRADFQTPHSKWVGHGVGDARSNRFLESLASRFVAIRQARLVRDPTEFDQALGAPAHA